MNRRNWLACAALLALAGGAPAHAGQIRSPSVIGSTLGLGGGNLGHLTDRTGLTPAFTTGVTDFETYIAMGPTSKPVSGSTGWAGAANKVSGYLEFDLGAVYDISGFVMWTQNNPDAVNSFSLISAQDANFTTGVSNLGSFNGVVGLQAQTFIVTGAAEFVRLQINSVFPLGTAVNIGEVAFDTEIIPEPASCGFLGMGFAGAGLLRRRRSAR